MTSREKSGVIHVIIALLQSPELTCWPDHHQQQQQTVATVSGASAGVLSSSNAATVTRTGSDSIATLTTSTLAVTSSTAAATVTTATSMSAGNKRPSHHSLPPLYLEIIELLLKCLKNLSMEPSVLGDLEAAGTIETLIPLLSGPISDPCKANIFPCLFNLCRVNRHRQDLVATHGLIPHLKKVIQAHSNHLRQFALPIFFDLAHASKETRNELWKYDCVSLYLDLLSEHYWQQFALNSLSVW
jgi:hypothetical protein